NADYTLTQSDSVSLLSRSKNGVLSAKEDNTFSLCDKAIFLPARSRVRVGICLPYGPESELWDLIALQIKNPGIQLPHLTSTKEPWEMSPAELATAAKKQTSSPTEKEILTAEPQLRKWIATRFPDLGGFVLFDAKNRYQIDFPQGW